MGDHILIRPAGIKRSKNQENQINKTTTIMEFQAAPVDVVPMEASLDAQLEDSLTSFAAASLDNTVESAQNAAKEAADAVDDLVRHLYAADPSTVEEAVVANDSAAEPAIEELLQSVQQSLEVPFLLIAGADCAGGADDFPSPG